MSVSFILPARNEEEHIGRSVSSIRQSMTAIRDFEILVVDNGSTDDTVSIAQRAGAVVLNFNGGTIGRVRNYGVKHSSGDVLVFLDGDCVLTADWAQRAPSILERVLSTPLLLVGSQVVPPATEKGVFAKYWFTPFAYQIDASHIGSAHMICSRETFIAVGGFSCKLETGEDYDICTRILRSGGKILNTPELRVEHYGFPGTLLDFMHRERWHGRGDVESIRAFTRSRVALTSLLLPILVVSAIISAAFGNVFSALSLLAISTGLILGIGWIKFGHTGLKGWIIGSWLLVPYFVGRWLSIVDAILAALPFRNYGVGSKS